MHDRAAAHDSGPRSPTRAAAGRSAPVPLPRAAAHRNVPSSLAWLLAAAALCLLLALAPQAWAQALVAIPPLDAPVIDTTGTLDAAQRRQLEQQALGLQQRKGSQLQVLMVASTQPGSIEDYTQRVFDQWKLGRAGVDDAVLVVVAKDDRRARIQPGYGLEGAIPDITAGRVIQEYMAPRFRDGDYGGGLVDATAVLVKLIDGEALPAALAEYRGGSDGGGADGDDSGGGNWMFALFAAFMAASLARGMFARLPAVLRGVFTGGAAGGVAWLVSSLVGLGAAVALLGFFFGLARAPAGTFARRGGWGGFGGGSLGGGSWGGGGLGGGGGGGSWSGGGGMSGGGGASGSW